MLNLEVDKVYNISSKTQYFSGYTRIHIIGIRNNRSIVYEVFDNKFKQYCGIFYNTPQTIETNFSILDEYKEPVVHKKQIAWVKRLKDGKIFIVSEVSAYRLLLKFEILKTETVSYTEE